MHAFLKVLTRSEMFPASSGISTQVDDSVSNDHNRSAKHANKNTDVETNCCFIFLIPKNLA